MRSIQRRFKNLEQRNDSLSSFINFSRAIEGQNFSKDAISHWFNRLVEKDDYEACDKKEILKHFIALSTPEDATKHPKNSPW